MKKLYLLIVLSLGFNSLIAQNQNNPAFSESEITLKTKTGDIFGSLVVPDNMPTSPVVLIIAGSGPTDRDCNSPMLLKTDAYKMLATALAKEGFSSLRYDKRGIAKSKAAMTQESEIRFEMYIQDAEEWIGLLKADRRFSGVIVLGHSEGSLIGMIAASGTEVKAFVSVSGVGQSADKILQQQLKDKLPPGLLAESNSIMDSLRNGKTLVKVNPSLANLYRPSVQPYLISWMKYQPTDEIKKISVPVMIIQGNRDLQVDIEEAKLLAKAKPDARLFLVVGMNHILKDAEADAQKNLATYNDPSLPLKKEFVEGLLQFLKAVK